MTQDLRLAFRLMVRQPLMATTAIVALTVGIGLANVGFATVEAMLFSELPFDNEGRFVRLSVRSAKDRSPASLNRESYVRLLTGATGIEHVGAHVSSLQSAVLPSGLHAEVAASAVTASSLAYIPTVPLRGRLLATSDGLPDAAPVAVISEAFWRRTLNASEGVVGSTIVVGPTPHIVVGVMPATFEFPNSPAVWVALDERFRSGDVQLDSTARLFGVLAPGATLEKASAQLDAIGPLLKTAAEVEGVAVEVSAITDLGDMAGPLAAAIVLAVLAVLIVIAANVGNLVLVRSFARAREFAVRAALGASRVRLVTQVVTEVLVIGGVSAVLGSIIAGAILRQLNGLDDLPFWVDFTGSALTTVMVAAATLLATGVAGAWPALKATRQDALGGLRGDGRASDVAFGRAAGLIVVTQIAMSIVMLHGAFVVAQAVRAYNTPAVALPQNVLTLGLLVKPEGVSVAEVERQASVMPGVLAAGLSTALPRHSPEALLIEVEVPPGAPALPARRAPSASVSPTYFDVLNATTLAGRNFTAADSLPGAPPVAIVNEPFVREVLGGTAPVGRRFRVTDAGWTGAWTDIIGVVPDLGLSMGDPTFAAGYYLPLKPADTVVYLALRTAGEPMTLAEPLRRWVRERDSSLTMFTPERLEDVAADDRSFFAIVSSALSGIGAITLALALVGVYSMMSLIITRRTREIGIRVALGATPALVIRAVAARAAIQILVGGGVGAVLALLSLQGRSILVSRLSDGGTWTLPIVIALLIAAGLAATCVPLRRALSIRPQEALNAE